MSAKLFPPFISVYPTTLISAVESLSKMHSGTGLSQTPRWQRLLDKIRKGDKLTAFEKIQMANNCGSIPTEMQEAFGILFRNDLNEETLTSASLAAATMLAPSESIQLLTHLDIVRQLGEKHLPSGVFAAKAALGRDPDEATWLDSKIREGVLISDVLKSFELTGLGTLSPGQKRIARKLITSPSLHSIVNKEFNVIMNLLVALRSDGNDALALVDEMLAHYFIADPAWTTKVLEEKFFLAIILSKLPVLSSENSRVHQYRNIELLRKKAHEITDALKMLNDAEPERGDFWRKYISFCHYVEPKRIDKTTVATAFAFPAFVVVDYGPKGSAALLYERKTFEASVRETKRWRDLDFVKSFPPYTNDGRLVHGNNWQRQFNDMIVFLLRNGGTLK